MRTRTIVGVFVLVSALMPHGGSAADGVVPHRNWAIVNFPLPTRVATHILAGPYLVVHDDEKQERGEPCTSFYLLDRDGGREPTVTFHCIPRQRPVVDRFTITTEWDDAFGLPILTEYQFARDWEGHGVPVSALAVRGVPRPAWTTCLVPARRP